MQLELLAVVDEIPYNRLVSATGIDCVRLTGHLDELHTAWLRILDCRLFVRLSVQLVQIASCHPARMKRLIVVKSSAL